MTSPTARYLLATAATLYILATLVAMVLQAKAAG